MSNRSYSVRLLPNAAYLTVIGAILSLPQAAHAQVVLTNLSGSPSFAGGTTLGNNNASLSGRVWKAVGLTTGSVPLELLSLRGVFNNSTDTTRNLLGGLYTNNAGNPGTQIVSWNTQTIAPTATDTSVAFTPSSGVVLNANTTYWFLLTSDVFTDDEAIFWRRLNPQVSPTGSNGVSLFAYRRSDNNQATWLTNTTFNSLEIQARVPAPEPGTMTLLALIGLPVAGGVARRRRSL